MEELNGCFKGQPSEISYPSEVMGQLIICDAKDFYIVVKTRKIEVHYEQSEPDGQGKVKNEPHYKIGGFIKIKPETLAKHNGIDRFIPCDLKIENPDNSDE